MRSWGIAEPFLHACYELKTTLVLEKNSYYLRNSYLRKEILIERERERETTK